MTTTKQTASQTFDAMESDPRWLGWGYLGERRNLRDAVAAGDWPASDLDRLAEVDAAVLAAARATNGMGPDRLFRWCNSSDGRHFADFAFSSTYPASEVVSRWGGLRVR